MKNINNQSHWNYKWLEEGKDAWRQYPNVRKQAIKYIKPNSSLIDLGCGNGVFLNYVNQNRKNMKLLGIDISSVAIKQLKQFYNIDGVVSKLPEIPYPIENESFDYVTIFETIEHIDDEKELMNNAFRILKKGGKLICSVPYDCSDIYKKVIESRDGEHIRWYDKNKLIKILTYYGKNPIVEEYKDFNTRNGIKYEGLYYIGKAEK
jgi:ubiquinone/menaquinone biosynthesis C-methylase UbiE